MSVIAFDLGRRLSARGPQLTDKQRAAQAVRTHLKGRCGPSLIAQAEARAERRVGAGNTVSEAVGYAVRWALSSTDFDPPPPQAA